MKKVKYILKEGGIHIIDSDFVSLNEKIVNEELHEYNIIDRVDFIDTLINWISESNSSDKFLMKEDLKMLMNWKDDYIFTSNLTNSYIGKDSDLFNETCEELLELNKNI